MRGIITYVAAHLNMHPDDPNARLFARTIIRVTLEHYQRNITEGMAVSGCKFDDPLGGLVDWRGEDTTTREAVTGVFKAMISEAIKELDD